MAILGCLTPDILSFLLVYDSFLLSCRCGSDPKYGHLLLHLFVIKHTHIHSPVTKRVHLKEVCCIREPKITEQQSRQRRLAAGHGLVVTQVYGPSATERPLRFIREEKGIYSRFLVSISSRPVLLYILSIFVCVYFLKRLESLHFFCGILHRYMCILMHVADWCYFNEHVSITRCQPSHRQSSRLHTVIALK